MRVMRIAVLVLVTLALTSCAEAERKAPSLDCEVAEREFLACLGSNDCLKLIPFGQPERMTGIWSFDFEENLFFENHSELPQNYWQSADSTANLWTEGSSLDDLVTGSRDRFVVDVSFVGRRELCDLLQSWQSDILVDRVVYLRIIDQRRSLRR